MSKSLFYQQLLEQLQAQCAPGQGLSEKPRDFTLTLFTKMRPVQRRRRFVTPLTRRYGLESRCLARIDISEVAAPIGCDSELPQGQQHRHCRAFADGADDL